MPRTMRGCRLPAHDGWTRRSRPRPESNHGEITHDRAHSRYPPYHTAIAGHPQRNIDFYAGVLGLRLVKKTVNFDDPGSYHLYYGDGLGHPGTIMNLLCLARRAAWTAGYRPDHRHRLSIPAEAVEFWATHLAAHGVTGIQASHPLRRAGPLLQ